MSPYVAACVALFRGLVSCPGFFCFFLVFVHVHTCLVCACNAHAHAHARAGKDEALGASAGLSDQELEDLFRLIDDNNNESLDFEEVSKACLLRIRMRNIGMNARAGTTRARVRVAHMLFPVLHTHACIQHHFLSLACSPRARTHAYACACTGR